MNAVELVELAKSLRDEGDVWLEVSDVGLVSLRALLTAHGRLPGGMSGVAAWFHPSAAVGVEVLTVGFEDPLHWRLMLKPHPGLPQVVKEGTIGFEVDA